MFEIIPDENFGLNFDPSHLVWQFIDIPRAIREFGPRIFHTHAKDLEVRRDGLYEQGVMSAGVGWQVPALLGQMAAADDFYFDSVSQVRLDRWSAGRVALIGDAGYAAGPGGNGTGTAVVAAYVLAGELAAADGDHRVAYDRYERLLRPYVARGQKQARGGRDFLAPATAKKIRQRDRFFRMLPYLPAKGLIRYLSTRTAAAITLPGYP